MPSVTERLDLPSPRKATTLEMCRVISRASGLPIATVWKAHPLSRYGRRDLETNYIHACNALDFGVDCATGAEIGIGRVMAMVFENDTLLHPLDKGRRELPEGTSGD